MIRKIKRSDREIYLKLVKEFYSSPAVLQSVDEQNFINTFDELIRSDTYAECYLIEKDNRIAGYALLSKTFSQEAGGLVYWIEEIFILPEFQNNGLGKEFFDFIDKTMPNNLKRLRLEVEKENERAVSLYKKLGYRELKYDQMYKDF